jgi:hypothetical protein
MLDRGIVHIPFRPFEFIVEPYLAEGAETEKSDQKDGSVSKPEANAIVGITVIVVGSIASNSSSRCRISPSVLNAVGTFLVSISLVSSSAIR